MSYAILHAQELRERAETARRAFHPSRLGLRPYVELSAHDALPKSPLPVAKPASEDKTKLDTAQAFMFNRLMLAPFVIRTILNTMTATALVALISELTTGNRREREEARRRLGLAPNDADKDKKKKDKEAAPSIIAVAATTIFIIAAPVALVRQGWVTLALLPQLAARAAAKMRRFALKGIGAVVDDKPKPSVTIARNAPELAATASI